MPETGITRLLKSAAREGATLQSDRHRFLFRLMSRDEPLDPLPENLTRRMLVLRDGWKVLDFRPRDWQQIGEIESLSDNISNNIVKLAVQYIRSNRDRVSRLVNASLIYSDCMIGRDQDDLSAVAGTIDVIDQQSVFMFKVQGIVHQFAHEDYIDYLRSKVNSGWVRTRLVGPMVYHVLNTPAEWYLDTFLSYMMPQDEGDGFERPTVRHILRDDLSFDRGLLYRSVIGMFCHPFDLLESFTNHFEIEAAKGDLPEQSLDIIRTLSDLFPESRAARLRTYLEWRLKPNHLHNATTYGEGRLPPSVTALIRSFVDPESSSPAVDDLPTEHWQSLARMRWSRYPESTDFEVTTVFARAYNFLEAGRLFFALNTSMYMLPRAPDVVERGHLLRLHAAAGITTPYIWGAPRGEHLMAAQTSSDVKGWLGADLKAGALLAKRHDAADRTWFHSVHWELRKAEKSVHVRRWLEIIREHFPVLPQYLTGVDWRWIDKVLPLTRVTPFRTNADGPFALLLRDIEEDNRDPTLLRTAIEPLTLGGTCSDFVLRLLEEYRESAIAFVRHFLSADTIMLLELAPNMTAALSERISALETCVACFGFSELLSEDELRLEQQALTASLMLLSVNNNQFDVPWASFKRDAGDRQRENYRTHQTMRSANKTLALITENTSLYSHKFPNGRVVDYTLTNNTGAVSLFALGVVDAFYDHPSYGIEAILSTRFRHDTFRREFSAAFDGLAASHIPGVVPQEQTYIVNALADACLSGTDEWLSRRMQTIRPGYDEALFDFTPTPDELAGLVETISAAANLEEAIDAVIGWITLRLDSGLGKALHNFQSELRDRIPSTVERACEVVQSEYGADPAVLRSVSSAVLATYLRTADLLMEWFSRPAGDLQPSLTFEQIKQAVDGRFERPIMAGDLSVTLAPGALAACEIKPENVKLFFDLQTEVVRNAIKYSDTPKVRVRIRQYENPHQRGFLFSSRSGPGKPEEREIKGHKYKSLSDALFREGNSGLNKVAALAASIYENDVTIKAVRRKRSFHLFVPLSKTHEAADA